MLFTNPTAAAAVRFSHFARRAPAPWSDRHSPRGYPYYSEYVEPYDGVRSPQPWSTVRSSAIGGEYAAAAHGKLGAVQQSRSARSAPDDHGYICTFSPVELINHTP